MSIHMSQRGIEQIWYELQFNKPSIALVDELYTFDYRGVGDGIKMSSVIGDNASSEEYWAGNATFLMLVLAAEEELG